jgi:hypothetical protein
MQKRHPKKCKGLKRPSMKKVTLKNTRGSKIPPMKKEAPLNMQGTQKDLR